MKFVVGRDASTVERDTVLLVESSWDDWFKFETQYYVSYIDKDRSEHDIGSTKIGMYGLRPANRDNGVPGESRSPQLPSKFRRLTREFFSLAQDPSFYEELSKLGVGIREQVLRGLRDIAYLSDELEKARHEEVTRVSLLRYVPLLTVQEQFARLAHGGARLTSYELEFELDYVKSKPTVHFSVVPGSRPATNIHVIVGRNGVGKSTFLNNLAARYVERASLLGLSARARDSDVANLVSVSFSAFDSFAPLSVSQDRTKGLTYHYVGLKHVGSSKEDREKIKGPTALAREMALSARACLQDSRRSRWVQALDLLEGDPIFASLGIAEAVGNVDDDEDGIELFLSDLKAKYRLLSSGHKIVLLTITRLVETVAEKSLVLLDEPEAHLHPPLLSAFVRALSDLLVNRNGVAVIATHSPVVLQEVPRTCVWKINRIGDVVSVDRPRIETFGENSGVLTNEVFGLEVASTGYHGLLLDLAAQYAEEGYEAALAAVDGQLGSEGRAILRAMVDAIRRSSRVAR